MLLHESGSVLKTFGFTIMDLEFSAEEIKEIVLVSFHYYYNASKWPAELNIMSIYLSDRITNEAPNTIMERGIITAMSFFLDQSFLISVNDQFPANQQLNLNVPRSLPANWRNNIVFYNQNFSMAMYYIRKRNQTFFLQFHYDPVAPSVVVRLRHTVVNHKPSFVEFREVDLLGLGDSEHGMAFALHFINMCSDEWTPIVKKAIQDAPPTAESTPLY